MSPCRIPRLKTCSKRKETFLDQITNPVAAPNDVADFERVAVGEREILVVGTAHVSQQSVDLVDRVIETERPDSVCLELDERRYQTLVDRKNWESLDLKTVIRNKQLSTLLINLLLAGYQKRLGDKMGVMPGSELLQAARTAEKLSIPFFLVDRDVRITLRRAWNLTSFYKKMMLLSYGLAGLFVKEEITEEKLAEMRKKDALNEMLNELGQAMPVLKSVLIDERDAYLAEKIRQTPGKKVVAVVGAGHVAGIVELLKQGQPIDLQAVETIPKTSSIWKWIGWAIPLMILGSIGYSGWDKGIAAAGDNLAFWILVNGIPCAIGALLAFGHPLTVVAALVSAPFTSLTPVIGAGYVTAFIQAYFRPPTVKEFQSVQEDVNRFSNWWRNKLLRILLVFILSGLGSALGTYVGMFEIFSNVF